MSSVFLSVDQPKTIQYLLSNPTLQEAVNKRLIRWYNFLA